MKTETLKSVTETMDQAIGLRVRKLRRAAGLSQSGLAEKLVITFQQIQKYENGKNRISASALVLICKALGVSAADVLGPFFEDDDASPGNAMLVAERLADAENKLASIRSIAA